MKSLVVMTYYHLMHSIALALTFDEKPNLYFSLNYLDIEEDFLDRIRETNVFNTVAGITKKGENQHFVNELKKTADLDEAGIDAIGTSLFEKYLEPKYAEYFKDADFNDELFIYNDFQLHYYFISKHFKKIVGIEDGYRSLPRQIGVHRFRKNVEDLVPFIERGYYPEPLYRHENVYKIISSVETGNEYYDPKLLVWDFKDIVAQNEEKFRQALLHIFNINSIEIKDHSSLYLGQPLDRAQYCNARENYLLYKKIIRREIEQGYTVYYKPHPAERNHIAVYGGDNVVVLPNDFPIEALNYMDRKFDRLVTFDSTGLSTLTCAREMHRYLKLTDFTKEELIDYIKKDVSGERIEAGIFIIVKECSPETYVNIYSWIFRNADVHTNLHILVEQTEDTAGFAEYYSKSNLDKRVSEYRKKYKRTQNEVRWHKELGWMKNWIDRYDPSVEIHAVSSFEEKDIYKEVISKADHDYLMLVYPNDPAFLITKAIAGKMRKSIFPVMYFRQYTAIEDGSGRMIRRPLLTGYLNDECSDGIINKMWHREVLKMAEKDVPEGTSLEVETKAFAGYITKDNESYLYLPPAKYYSVEDGESCYRNKVKLLEKAFENDRERLVPRLINVIYEYCDWDRVYNNRIREGTEAEAIETLIEDRELKYKIYKRMVRAVFSEKKDDDARLLEQDGNYYQELRPLIDKAAEVGLLNAVENIERIKNKIGINKQEKK